MKICVCMCYICLFSSSLDLFTCKLIAIWYHVYEYTPWHITVLWSCYSSDRPYSLFLKDFLLVKGLSFGRSVSHMSLSLTSKDYMVTFIVPLHVRHCLKCHMKTISETLQNTAKSLLARQSPFSDKGIRPRDICSKVPLVRAGIRTQGTLTLKC